MYLRCDYRKRPDVVQTHGDIGELVPDALGDRLAGKERLVQPVSAAGTVQPTGHAPHKRLVLAGMAHGEKAKVWTIERRKESSAIDCVSTDAARTRGQRRSRSDAIPRGLRSSGLGLP